MSIGVFWYSMADAELSPNFEIKGTNPLISCVFIVMTALVIDAVLPNIHEKLLNFYEIPMVETVITFFKDILSLVLWVFPFNFCGFYYWRV